MNCIFSDIEKRILKDLVDKKKISLDNYPLTEVQKDKKIKEFVYIINRMEERGFIKIIGNFYIPGGRTDTKYSNCAIGILNVNNNHVQRKKEKMP